MSSKATVHNSMRIYHRYLGFFLAGIMAIYALSGIVLIFRDTNFLKQERMAKQMHPHGCVLMPFQSCRCLAVPLLAV